MESSMIHLDEKPFYRPLRFSQKRGRDARAVF
jgi:hypothetical protein